VAAAAAAGEGTGTAPTAATTNSARNRLVLGVGLHKRQLLLLLKLVRRWHEIVVARWVQVQYNIAVRHVCFRWDHQLLSHSFNENNLD